MSSDVVMPDTRLRHPTVRPRLVLRAAALVAVVVLGACAGDDGARTAGPSASAPATGTAPAAGTSPTPGAATPGWHQLPDPPLSPRSGAAAAWTGREVVLVGGDEFLCPPGADCLGPVDPPFADGAAYDPATGTWRSIAPAPVGVRHAAVAALDGDVYLATAGELLRYRVDRDSWDVLGWMPGPWVRSGFGIVVDGGTLVFADATPTSDARSGWRYDPATATWSELPPAPLPAAADRWATSLDDRLVLAGVDRSSGGPRIVVAALDPGTGTWHRFPDRHGSGYQAWGHDGTVVVNPHFGPEAGGGILDPATGTWSPLPPAPAGFRGDLAGVLGRADASFEYAEGWVLDVSDRRWIEVPAVPAFEGSWPATRTAVGRDLFVYGGEHWSGRFGEEGRLLGEAWWWTAPAT